MLTHRIKKFRVWKMKREVFFFFSLSSFPPLQKVSKKKQKKHFDRLDWDIDLNRLFENPLGTLLSTMSHCNSIFEAEINSSCIICHKTFSRKDFRNSDSRRTITSNS